MEFVLILIIVIGAGLLLLQSNNKKKQAQAKQQEEVDRVRSAAAEDVTKLGEEVVALDNVTAGADLDEATRQDYQHALDSYEESKRALDAMRRTEDVKQVTEALEDGRYAIASVKARMAGAPLPTRRPPCFFNPQHGPSTDDVEWAPAGGIRRPVPACAADAERVRAGADPITRKVVGEDGTRRPYWEAGPAYAPYAGGYFGAYAMSGLLPGVLLGSMLMGGGFGAWEGTEDAGSDAGGDGAGGDGGDSGDSGDGGDAGGDMAGGDMAGGDMGAGDSGGFFDGGGFFGGGGGDGGGGFDGGGFGGDF